MFSLASIATMSACIFLFGSVFLHRPESAVYCKKSAEEGVAITVFFDEDATDKQIKEIGKKLEARDEVSSVQYVSADDAWKSFQKDYFKDNESLADGFKNDNPLANSANYQVFMKTLKSDNSDVTSEITGDEKTLSETQKNLVSYAESLDGVRKVNRSDVVANTLTSVNKLVYYVSIVIIGILLAVSIFLISNTVTTGITVRREEIAIMKYIGAKDFVVRSPFVIEGLIIGLIGALIPLAVLYFAYGRVIGYIMDKFSILNNIIAFLPVQSVYKLLLPAGLLMGVGIGFLGSFFTVRKHLKV